MIKNYDKKRKNESKESSLYLKFTNSLVKLPSKSIKRYIIFCDLKNKNYFVTNIKGYWKVIDGKKLNILYL